MAARRLHSRRHEHRQHVLARLAETLLPLLAEDKDAAAKEAQEDDAFATSFETAYAAGLSHTLGVIAITPLAHLPVRTKRVPHRDQH